MLLGDFDDDLEEDEVLSLNLPKSRRSLQDESADEEDEGIASAPKQRKPRKNVLSNRARDLLPLESKTRTSRFEKPTASTSKLSSDEESEAAESSEDEEAEEENADAEDDFDNEWARTGGYHVTRREIERMEEQASAPGGKFSADEEAEQRDALELYEARRIQKESKDKLDETDYIDVEELEEDKDARDDLLAVARVDRQYKLSQAPMFDSREEAIAHLLSREPELLALLDDFSACSDRLPLVQEAVKQLKGDARNERKLGLGYLYQGEFLSNPCLRRLTNGITLDALTTYLTLLAFYLHIRSHPSYPAVGAALAGTVLSRLVKVRSSISSMEDFGVLDLPGDERRRDLYADSEDEEGELEALDRDSLLARIGDLDDDELDALIAERQAILDEQELEQGNTSKSQAKGGKKRKAISASSESDENSDEELAQASAGKKKRRTRARKGDQKKATHVPLLNLEAPSISKKGAVTVAAPSTFNDDFVDATSLTADEVAEKAGKTKSLRFYTSKIAATSARRAGAGKERGGGDDDVPYRSKERAREAALRQQQHGSGEVPENTDLDTAGFDDADFALARQVNDAAPAADGYYDLVANSKKASKQAKTDAYEEATLGER